MIEHCIDALEKLRAIAIRPQGDTKAGPLEGDLLKQVMSAIASTPYTMFNAGTIEGSLSFEEGLSRTWSEFRELGATAWHELRSRVDASLAGLLLVYSMRMSILAVRHREKHRLYDAAMGLVIDNDLLDYRDVLTVACLIYDAATRIGIDPSMPIRDAMTHATLARRNLLEGYLTGPSYTKSITSMGFEALKTKHGFTYQMR